MACTGAAVDGPGAGSGIGGPLGGVGQTGNAADGTLSSQSGYQELAGGCGSDLALRFANEGKQPPAWMIRETEPAYFPKAKIGEWQVTDEFQPCADCQGRVLRVIDLGEAPGEVGTVAQHGAKVFAWVMAFSKDQWDPSLLPAARYRDFALNAAGESDLNGLEMLEDHLYFFLVSKQPMAPVTSWTGFNSIQELNDLADCPKDANPAPFFQVRFVHALTKEPVEFKPIQIPNSQENDQDEGPTLIQMPDHAPAHFKDLNP